MTEEKWKQVKVTHIMANGEVRDSLDGYEINPDNVSEVAKRILRDLMFKKRDSNHK